MPIVGAACNQPSRGSQLRFQRSWASEIMKTGRGPLNFAAAAPRGWVVPRPMSRLGAMESHVLSCSQVSAMQAFLLNFLIFMCTRVNSPLITSIAGTIKDLFTNILGMTLFGDFPFNALNLVLRALPLFYTSALHCTRTDLDPIPLPPSVQSPSALEEASGTADSNISPALITARSSKRMRGVTPSRPLPARAPPSPHHSLAPVPTISLAPSGTRWHPARLQALGSQA